MKKLLTQEKLVLFVYDEISDPQERKQIEKEIRSSSKWYQMYIELVEARKLIDPHPDGPSVQIVKEIMEYSRSLDLQSAHDKTTRPRSK